jgi:hypothetical protein
MIALREKKRCKPEEPFASCAKPTAGGLERKTEYTFFCVRLEKNRPVRIGCLKPEQQRIRTRNVSPTIHCGVPEEGLTLEPAVISKMAPRQRPLLTGPTFRSAGLIGHAGPPNDIAMLS